MRMTIVLQTIFLRMFFRQTKCCIFVVTSEANLKIWPRQFRMEYWHVSIASSPTTSTAMHHEIHQPQTSSRSGPISVKTRATAWQNQQNVCPAMTQIQAVWSESSLCAQWVAKNTRFLHADSKDSDQTARTLGTLVILLFCGSNKHSLPMLLVSWHHSNKVKVPHKFNPRNINIFFACNIKITCGNQMCTRELPLGITPPAVWCQTITPVT